MRTLPSLPGCGQPATVRIEIYSPGPTGNAHGSLDGVAYGCGQHAGAIVQMIADAGLTPWHDPKPLDAADTSVCGRLRDFGDPVYPAGPADHNGEPVKVVESSTQPSGDGSPASVAAFIARNRVPEPGPVQHPRWCARREATGNPLAEHLSIPFRVNPDAADPVVVFIVQAYGAERPSILLGFTEGREHHEHTIPLDVAAALGQQLRIAVSLAGVR
ncbi:hypothetical protein [Plantactinospora sp. BB1]|uniref:hypothetical protein n=1 Tax=Plantactinospora sp. BB1 TaxID=2071627 RepID=UPI000D151E74|nr:hypothetical protein [Plantactinospora sp. BB1]AVT37411.1 hypothetical protein C6W10_14085 [Plantactinospora sp. BB1]